MPVCLLSALHQKYRYLLEPVALAKQLQKLINPLGTSVRLFQQHSFVGKVDSETQTFIAQTRHTRSTQVITNGHWWSMIDDANVPLTVIELSFHIPRADLLPIIFLALLALAATVVALVSNYFLAAVGITLFGLFTIALPWLSLRLIQRHFEQVLLLERLP